MNPKSKVKYDDADIERVRRYIIINFIYLLLVNIYIYIYLKPNFFCRAHLNDLENIPPFIIVCFGYLLTIPNVYIATNLIRLFVASRIIHTIVYAVVVLPQPARGLSWFAGFATTVYMAVQVILSFV